MFKKDLQKLLLASSCVLLFAGSAMAAPDTFQLAVAEYKAGKYQSALTKFKTVASGNPKNALVHYWMALCHHQLGHPDQAKQEYQVVVSMGDAKLKPLAEAGLGKITSIKTSSSSASSGAGSPSQTTPVSKVKKIIEFYADW